MASSPLPLCYRHWKVRLKSLSKSKVENMALVDPSSSSPDGSTAFPEHPRERWLVDAQGLWLNELSVGQGSKSHKLPSDHSELPRFLGTTCTPNALRAEERGPQSLKITHQVKAKSHGLNASRVSHGAQLPQCHGSSTSGQPEQGLAKRGVGNEWREAQFS